MKQSLPLAHISTSRLHACCVYYMYINKKGAHSDRHKHSRAVALSMASEQFGHVWIGAHTLNTNTTIVDRRLQQNKFESVSQTNTSPPVPLRTLRKSSPAGKTVTHTPTGRVRSVCRSFVGVCASVWRMNFHVGFVVRGCHIVALSSFRLKNGSGLHAFSHFYLKYSLCVYIQNKKIFIITTLWCI